MSKIKDNFINTPILVASLCLMFFDWAGYGYLVFYLPFIYLLFNGIYKYIDKTFGFLLVWGLFYSLACLVNGAGFGYQKTILPIINYPGLYLCGKFLAEKNDGKQLVNIFFLLSIALALLFIASIIKSVGEVGFLFADRNIPILSYDSSIIFAATGIYSHLVILSSFLIYTIMAAFSVPKKMLYISIGGLAFFCGLRLQSRTMLFLLLLSFIFAVIVNRKSIKGQQRMDLIVGTIILVIVGVYVYMNFSQELGVIDRIQDDSEYGVQTGGGREQLLLYVLGEVLTHPFGCPSTSINIYAHNMWIDCARVGGWIPFILLLLISIRCIKTTLKIMKTNIYDYNFCFFVSLFTFVFLVFFCTEPILEGSIMLFSLFCVYLGIIEGCVIRNGRNCMLYV